MMRFRRLGRTGLSVSELTLGTAALGRNLREAGATVARALALGINAIEIHAGDREIANLVGEVLRRESARDHVHVIARVSSLVRFDLPSPHVPVQHAYPGRHIRADTEALLAALGVERLALQQLHAWCPEWRDEGDWQETFDRLRAEGKIAGFGVSLFDHDVEAALEIVASGAIDSVEVMYNVFDPAAATTLLPQCRVHDVAVIARSPLYFGAFARAPDGEMRDFPADDWRHAYFFDAQRRETAQRVQRLTCAAEAPDRTLSDLALRFSLSHPTVSTVAVGMRTPAQVEANVAALGQGLLDAEQLATLAAHKWLC